MPSSCITLVIQKKQNFPISMEENPVATMARTGKIIRRSIYTFLQHYQYLTSIAAFLALPFSISVLISQAILPHSLSLFPAIYTRFHWLLDIAGFPSSSTLFSIVNLKLSQTLSSSIVTLPFTISFLLFSKASIIHYLNSSTSTNKQNPSSCLSFIWRYTPLLSTYLCNSLIIFAANATSFSLLFLGFNLLEGFQITSPRWVLFLSAIGAVFYSIILANALVICNLALISSGMEAKRKGGFMEILRACILIRGNTSTALGLAVPINLGLAAIEALFHFRIITSHDLVDSTEGQLWMLALEGSLIAYLYSILLVLDVIMSCMFYQSCKKKTEILLSLYYTDEILLSLYHTDEEVFYHNDNVEKLKGLEGFV